MNVDNGKYYLYRHIRLDTNEPFYIGIGTKKDYKTFNSIYARARCKVGRNKYWTNITEKTNYKIEILLESNEYEFIKNKEIEYIDYYKKLYTLANFTKGGDGHSVKHKKSAITKMKITNELKRRSIRNKIEKDVLTDYQNGLILTVIAKKYNVCKNVISYILNNNKAIKNSSNYKKTYFYYYNFLANTKTEYYLNYNTLAKILGISEVTIRNYCYKKTKIQDKGHLVLLDNISLEDAKTIYNSRCMNVSKIKNNKEKIIKRIVQKSKNGEIVKIWEMMKDILKYYNLKSSTPILRVIKNKRKTYKNSIWERE
jgi:hypothetical protein